jgi:hypothetical protein
MAIIPENLKGSLFDTENMNLHKLSTVNLLKARNTYGGTLPPHL